ncbi:MAG: aldo/keto reductase [Mesorhizobium sp.]|nr:aldo/keto reductase [Mesorhizobium sp.]
MHYVRFGKSNLKVSRLCLGAMGFGSTGWRAWVLGEKGSTELVARALDHGINFFDTCDFYSAGESERILGRALAGQARDSYVVATKAGNPMATHSNGRGYSRKHLFKAIDDSLTRLGVEHVDLFQTHIWDKDADLDELLDVMADIVRAGKALYVGATTMPAWTLAILREKAAKQGLPAFMSMQCEYNPAHRECERELLGYCRYENLAVIPFSPMARGFLSADRRKPANVTPRTASDDYTRKYYYRDSDHAVQVALNDIADKIGKTPSQVALAWTLGRTGVTAPIFGATTVAQVDQAVAALDISLAPEDVATIDDAYEPRSFEASGH